MPISLFKDLSLDLSLLLLPLLVIPFIILKKDAIPKPKKLVSKP